MIIKLIWRNLWRNSRRTLITVTSIAFALMFSILMKSLQEGTFNHLIKNVVGYYSGYIQIHKKGYWEEQIMDNSFEFNDSLALMLNKNPGVKNAVPRLESFVLVSKGNLTKGCYLIGTDPGEEDTLTKLRHKLVAGEYFQNSDEMLLISEGLAERLKAGLGDTIVLLGQGYHGALAAGKYPIKGILHLASPEMNKAFIYMPLASARYFLSADQRVTSVAIGIDNPDRMEALLSELKTSIHDQYEVMSWKEMMPEIEKHIKADASSFILFSGILYLIIGFGLFGTVMMMTAERKYEFGMLLAIGMKKNLLKMILLGEAIFISLTGILTGVIFSLPLVVYLKKYPIRFSGELAKMYENFGFEAVMPTDVIPAVFLNQSLTVLIMALLIGLYPVWHITKIKTIEAMKR